MKWRRLTVAVVGGDEREPEIARHAAQTGARVRAYGFPWPEAGVEGVALTSSAREAMRGADYAFLPIPRGAEDNLYAPAAPAPIRVEPGLFAPLAPGAHVFCGRASTTGGLRSRKRPCAELLSEIDRPGRGLLTPRSCPGRWARSLDPRTPLRGN